MDCVSEWRVTIGDLQTEIKKCTFVQYVCLQAAIAMVKIFQINHEAPRIAAKTFMKAIILDHSKKRSLAKFSPFQSHVDYLPITSE